MGLILCAFPQRQVEKINRALLEDYECRRQMMIKRFQVTLQSFAWGEKEQVPGLQRHVLRISYLISHAPYYNHITKIYL